MTRLIASAKQPQMAKLMAVGRAVVWGTDRQICHITYLLIFLVHLQLTNN